MKIKYLDEGTVSKIIVTSFITERRKHNRCVDAALLMVPVRAWSTGFLLRKTAITGKTTHVLRAYKIICREGER
ncbi:hypothetical protein C5467_24140 [Photorhabdus khanii subsp. guanajuatensis]|uniref:Uncharacterized protein n=2 Tax=Photorhabdus khanii TaxID=1004150 RepID=A0A4R4INH8_9GAMM|nr:hypothetical protein [Photorhabdus khanii]TDB42084.1 hypothetical protein C5467_24140 [Photorhabdus khanii subsp. guanajuatensis]